MDNGCRVVFRVNIDGDFIMDQSLDERQTFHWMFGNTQFEFTFCQWNRDLCLRTFLHLRQIVEWRGIEQGGSGKNKKQNGLDLEGLHSF